MAVISLRSSRGLRCALGKSREPLIVGLLNFRDGNIERDQLRKRRNHCIEPHPFIHELDSIHLPDFALCRRYTEPGHAAVVRDIIFSWRIPFEVR